MSRKGYGSIVNSHPDHLEVDTKNENDPHKTTSTSTRRIPRTLQVVVGATLVLIFYLLVFPSKGTLSGTIKSELDPNEPHFYRDQLVDHNEAAANSRGRYSQRYYENTKYFGGPGSPIFFIIGGEDELTRILYPFVSEHLGKKLNAYTICAEHRFYGESMPVRNPSNEDLRALLSPYQAMYDAVRLIQLKQKELGCGERGTLEYCPVMTVGASYPGFLSALMRLVHSDTVDIGYASSAPLKLYSHEVNQSAYYEKVTIVSEEVAPGCANAVRQTLYNVRDHIINSSMTDITYLATEYGVCTKKIPSYINSNAIFVQELEMVVATHFADYNMGYYPPNEGQELAQACQIFQDGNHSDAEKVAAFLQMEVDSGETCFDLTNELPPGPNATISAADWSGVGGGPAGLSWDFQSCFLIPECGFSEESMFPLRPWTLDWLTDHCQSRFGVTPIPQALVERFHFDNLTTVNRLLFTNGLRDGWSVASILEERDNNISSGIRIVNMPLGAHHSDLTHEGPMEHDTPDVKAAHLLIADTITKWIEHVQRENEAVAPNAR